MLIVEDMDYRKSAMTDLDELFFKNCFKYEKTEDESKNI